MEDIGKQFNEFVEEMVTFGPQKVGLLTYFKRNYRQIMIMKHSGYTTKQITDFINGRIAEGQILELSKPVSVVYFNKAWREFCIKRNISTKPTASLMQQIEADIFSYRDIVTKAKTSTDQNPQKVPNPTQETAVQLAELIKFLLELLRQNTGRSVGVASQGLRSAAEDVSEFLEEGRPNKTVVPADPELSSVNKERIAAFFADDD